MEECVIASSRDQRTDRRIRAREVRVVGPEGEQLGVLPIEAALSRASSLGLNLVEVNPMAKPPVCKIMDYGRFKYEEKKKANEAKKKQVVVKIKEVKLRPKTEDHDYDTKVRHAKDFVEEGNKVKVTIMFRGREITHREKGHKLLEEVLGDLKDVAIVEQAPRMEGRQMFMLLSPNPKVAQRARDAQRQQVAEAEKEKLASRGAPGAPASAPRPNGEKAEALAADDAQAAPPAPAAAPASPEAKPA